MNSRPAKKVSESAVHDHVYKLFSTDLNSNGTVFGGLIMSIGDRLAGVVAERHSGTTVVTASVDAMNFIAPAHKGENLIFQAAVNRTWNTSMEVGIRVLAEDSRKGERRHILAAYFTFVALDEDNKPTMVPLLICETEDEQHRYEEAEDRRLARRAHAAQQLAKREEAGRA